MTEGVQVQECKIGLINAPIAKQNLIMGHIGCGQRIVNIDLINPVLPEYLHLSIVLGHNSEAYVYM